MHGQKLNLRKSRRTRLALLLPGHNEELIIAATIRSALASGMQAKDIYVVDDGSTDSTRQEAAATLPDQNILSVSRRGKAHAVRTAIDHFGIIKRYKWLHVADADSIFCPDYFHIYRSQLDARQWAAAVGFVQSMHGNWISHYRSFSYTYGQHIFRRVQSWFGVISILPGPVTCFRTDIIDKLDFTARSLTEDFDLTLQIHRKKLGRIKFIPEAVNFTQDPRTLPDFYRQTMRWQRGFFQGVRKYRIGMRPHWIDLGVGYQMSESLFYFLQYFVFIPLLLVQTHHWEVVPIALAADYIVICILAGLSAAASRRPAILWSLLYFYVLRPLELWIFLQAFVEVIILGRHKHEIRGWSTDGRRYQLDAKALEEAAQ